MKAPGFSLVIKVKISLESYPTWKSDWKICLPFSLYWDWFSTITSRFLQVKSECFIPIFEKELMQSSLSQGFSFVKTFPKSAMMRLQIFGCLNLRFVKLRMKKINLLSQNLDNLVGLQFFVSELLVGLHEFLQELEIKLIVRLQVSLVEGLQNANEVASF